MFGWGRNHASEPPVDYGMTGADAPILREVGTDVKPQGTDRIVILITAFWLCLGSIVVYSASISFADRPKFTGTSNWHFLMRHIVAIVLSLILASVVYRVPMRKWDQISMGLLITGILLLIIVLFTPLGTSVNGSKRWINLRVMNVQVTEIMKFAAVLAAAHFTVKKQEYMHSFIKGFFPMALMMGIIAVLISMQPDLGAIVVITAIIMGVLFLGGLNLNIFIFVSTVVVLLVAFTIYDSPWRLQRVMAYLDPWSGDYALNKAYQLSHSLIAFGRGEWFGVGLGASVEKLHYLPEAHTDFILAVVGEELGLVGVLVILFAYYWLVRRAFAIGRQAIKLGRVYSGLVAEGIGIWIGVQVIINGGVATGLFPTKGLTLPLMSYGGSSIMATMAGIALLLRVDRETRILMRGGRV